jgi:hypothetical protein
MTGRLDCARTGLTIPECSCPVCTVRIMREHAPEPTRGEPVYVLTRRRALGAEA